MPQRSITTFATAIAFGALASTAIAAPEQQTTTAGAGSECHAAPQGVAPQGAHWYYKTDRATKKKCWYLADQVAKQKKTTSTVSTRSSASDDPAPKPDQTADNNADKSVADARAEIPANRKPASPKPVEKIATEDQNLAESVWPALSDKSESVTPATSPAASNETSAFASRWPDQTSTAPSTDAQAMLARKQAEQQQAAAQPQPAPASTTVGRANAATPAEHVEPNESSVSTLGLALSVLAGLLALAAIIGPAVFKRVYRQQPKVARRGIWDSVDSDNPPMPWDADMNGRNDNAPHESHHHESHDHESHAEDLTNELERILRRESRRSAA
jgi:hypothetical protein